MYTCHTLQVQSGQHSARRTDSIRFALLYDAFSISQYAASIVGRLVSNELEGIWKETVVAYSKYSPGTEGADRGNPRKC
jgi:hypothetical protein